MYKHTSTEPSMAEILLHVCISDRCTLFLIIQHLFEHTELCAFLGMVCRENLWIILLVQSLNLANVYFIIEFC